MAGKHAVCVREFDLDRVTVADERVVEYWDSRADAVKTVCSLNKSRRKGAPLEYYYADGTEHYPYPA